MAINTPKYPTIFIRRSYSTACSHSSTSYVAVSVSLPLGVMPLFPICGVNLGGAGLVVWCRNINNERSPFSFLSPIILSVFDLKYLFITMSLDVSAPHQTQQPSHCSDQHICSVQSHKAVSEDWKAAKSPPANDHIPVPQWDEGNLKSVNIDAPWVCAPGF